MKNATPVPEELVMIDKQFKWRSAWTVGKWWFAALIVSAVWDVFWPELKQQSSFSVRTAVVFAEFGAIALFCFDARQWILRMDELQRRITVELFLFSVSATFCFFLLWLRLEREGFFHAVFGTPFSPNGTWGISSVAHACALLGGFYGIGFLILKRRYK